MSPTENISDELTHGPAWLFVAPSGTAEPTLADVEALLAGTFTGFESVGKTSTPVVRTYTPEYRQVRSTQAARPDANLIVGEDITVGTTLLQVTYDRLREATNADVTSTGGGTPDVPGTLSGVVEFDEITIEAGDDIVVSYGPVNEVTVELSAGTYSAVGFAALLEGAIRGRLEASGFIGMAAAVEKIAITAEQAGADGLVTISNGSYIDFMDMSLTIADGNGTPLAGAPGLIGTVPAATPGASGTASSVLRPRGIGRATEYALAVVGPFGTGQSLTTAERVSITSAVELSDTREEETKLAVTWTVLEGDYALYLPADA